MFDIGQRISGKKKRLGFYLLVSIHEGLKRASNETGVPMSEILAVVMAEWLEDQGYIEDAYTALTAGGEGGGQQ